VLDADALLRRLTAAGVQYVVVGGFAVIAHGVIRATKDLDICPEPERPNLDRLAGLMADLHATQADTGDFLPRELPYDPTRADDLALGGNFRLVTDLGELDLLQWISGIDPEPAFEALDADAIAVDWHGITIRVCSLEHLRAMKRAAGRPQDLKDLADLEIANGSG
jgi:hypothetical protein